MRSRRVRGFLRRVAGFLWLVAWMAVLYVAAAPWRQLGGIVDERLRWLEWFVLVVGLSVGFVMGRFARDVAGPGSGRTHLDVLRCLVYPIAILVAVALVVLTILGRRDPVGVVVTAFLSYWAGMDIALGAVPLMDGQPHGMLRPVDPDREPERVRSRTEDAWEPPWERLP